MISSPFLNLRTPQLPVWRVPTTIPSRYQRRLGRKLRIFFDSSISGIQTCYSEAYHGLTMNLNLRMHDDYVASLTDWIATLSISTRLIFEKVRERAIKEITARLDQVEAFDLIELAIKFDVEQWLKPAYRRIVTRSTLIAHAEAARVPFPMAVMLMRSREQFWKNNPHNFRHRVQPQAMLSLADPTISPDPIIDAEIRLMVVEPAAVISSWRRSTITARTAATVNVAAEHWDGSITCE